MSEGTALLVQEEVPALEPRSYFRLWKNKRVPRQESLLAEFMKIRTQGREIKMRTAQLEKQVLYYDDISHKAVSVMSAQIPNLDSELTSCPIDSLANTILLELVDLFHVHAEEVIRRIGSCSGFKEESLVARGYLRIEPFRYWTRLFQIVLFKTDVFGKIPDEDARYSFKNNILTFTHHF
jgi:hypothetical protein